MKKAKVFPYIIGGIIAFFVFDIIDGFADGYLRIKISGGYLKRC